MGSALGYLWPGSHEELSGSYARVTWRDGLITDVVAVDPPGFSGDDRWISPGFIDGHVHLCLDGSSTPPDVQMKRSLESIIHTSLRSARSLLSCGVTSARDLGMPHDVASALRCEFARNPDLYPDVDLSGPPLTVPNGHLACFGNTSTGDFRSLSSAIERHARRGYRWLKLIADGGHITPGSSPSVWQFDPEEIAFVAHEAKSRGLRIAVHAHTQASVTAALNSRVDSIEHATLIDSEPRFSLSPPVEAAFRDNGGQTVVVPTIACNIAESSSWGPRSSLIRQLHGLGVPLASGTDAGIPRTPHGRFGDSLEWIEGMNIGDPTTLSTSLAASRLGLDGRGLIAPGMRADLLLRSRQPIDTSFSDDRVSLLVIKGGHLVH